MTTSTPSEERARVAPTGCCPIFDPRPWYDREVVWREHPFVKAHVRSLFHIPLGIGRTIKRAHEQIEAAGAEPPQPLMLTDEESRWGADLYLDVTRPVPHAEMAELSGTFKTRVYDGPFRDAGKWAHEMEQFVRSQGLHPQKIYFWYTTCPRCAKAYGHNYVVAFAKVA